MKKIFIPVALFLCLNLSVAAQSRSRVFDNFDTSKGVRIVTPTVRPIVQEPSKKLVKKTAQTMSVTEGYGVKNVNVASNYGKMTMGASSGMGIFTTGDNEIDSYISDSCKKYSIDPLLIYSQMHQESSFKLKATSYKGARGLMQLMPATATRLGVKNIYDPKQNIEGGVKYMRMLLDMFGGDVVLALAGYNAGEGAVMKYGNQVPPYRETQEYVRRITDRYRSISTPGIVKSVRKVTEKQAEKLEKIETKPLTVLEKSAVAIKLPDGRMRLVNQ